MQQSRPAPNFSHHSPAAASSDMSSDATAATAPAALARDPRRQRRDDGAQSLDEASAPPPESGETLAPLPEVVAQPPVGGESGDAPEGNGKDEKSTEKSIAALVTWLLGAALTAGSAAAITGGSGSDAKPQGDPKPEPQPEPKPEPKPEPQPEPKPEPKPEPQPEPKPEPKPEPEPEPKPEPKPEPEPPVPTPPAPQLTLHAPGAVRDGLLGAAGEVRVGALEAGAHWEFSIDGGKTWHAGSGSALSPSALGADGSKSLLAVQVNDRGARSPATELKFEMDTIAPSGPTLALVTDSGSSSSDGCTNDGTIRVEGLEVGARWQYSLDDGATWLTGMGATIASARLGADGVKHLRVRQTDQAGNEGPDTRLRVELDTHATEVTLALVNDTGSVGDRITSDAALVVSGLEPGSSWEYRIGFGDWRTGSGDRIAASEFNVDGRYEVELRQTDLAGNISVATLDFTRDSRVDRPTATLATDTGAANDGLTNDPTIDVANLESNGSWDYRINGGAWQRGSGARIQKSAFDGVADGSQLVDVRQTDVAGNRASTSLTFQLDRTAPAALTAALASDTGTKGDLITRDATLSITGFELGTTWSYRIDGGNWIRGDGHSIDAKAFSADGLHKVDLRQTDAAGNEAGSTFEFILDRKAEVPVLALIRDTGASATDRVTSDGRVEVSGLERGATWEYSIDGLDWTAGAGTSIAAAAFGADGAKRVLVRQTDGAGNLSQAAELRFTLDTQAALPGYALHSQARDNYPNVDALEPLFHTGSTVNRETWVQVSLEAGATQWSYAFDGSADFVVGRPDGRIDLNGLTTEGTHEIRIRQQDAAGNWSADRAINVTVDLTAPTVTGQYASALPDASQTNGIGFNANEAVQVLFIPFDTANDGSAQSYLQNWRQGGLLVEPGEESFRPAWRDAAPGLHVVVAVDKAGNASFVSMKGESSPSNREVHVVELKTDSTFQDIRVVDARPEQPGGPSIARASSATDHLFGSAAADVFAFASPQPGIDWIHGYNRGQGDVIELGRLQFNVSSAADIARYIRKDFVADGTISLWIDYDGRGDTAANNFDLRILVTADGGTDLLMRTATGATFVI